jgi:AcrR family transcriptional regulator
MASERGLDGLTIGTLAERMGLSKSGVFAHFGSREDLQIAVTREYARLFVDEVMRPALKERRGLARLRAIVERWCAWQVERQLPGGCIYFAGAMEFDDKPGPVRDEIVAGLATWRREMARAVAQAVETGELAPDTDPAQFVFELYGIMLGFHHELHLFDSPDARALALRAFERLLSCATAAPAAA